MFTLACTSKTIPSQIPLQDARNADIITTNTHLPLPKFSSLSEWEQRKAFLRNQILVSAGLSPLPNKAPLHSQIFDKLETKDYTIEKVLIETLPGFYLGGNLYRPRNGAAKHPAILNPHGHWTYGRLENTPVFSGPSLGISLSRQGYVVFAYDMLGYNDTVQLPHRFGNAEQRLWSFGPLGLQLWNSIRALDFLASLDDVDPAQLGATGASGGATQVFLLTAVDDRIQFASPVNMVSAIMQGGDLCENAPGLRLGTSNVEIAAMFAPKPMLLVSATGDWTHNVPKEEFPAIQRIYDLYGKADQLGVVQFKADHNFNQESREAVYRFFSKHHPQLTAPGELHEHDISVPMLQEMLALSKHPLPQNALDADGVFSLWKSLASSQNQQNQAPDFLRSRLRQTLAVQLPRDVIVERHGDQIVLSRESKKDRVPGLWFDGKGNPAIVINPDRSSAADQTEIVRQLKKDGRSVFLLDAFQTGIAKAPRPGDFGVSPPSKPGEDEEESADAAAGYPKFLTFNVSINAARVQDILTAVAYASRDHQQIDIYANGDACIWATFAAAVSDVPLSLHLGNAPSIESDADYLKHFNVPGILRAGGITTANQLLKSSPGIQ
ncbi:MAG: hypothetical protein JST28_06980 [Acidobacteria bacterium]|nr:hypothetical protein [Acidobacteriota bacterium]